MEASACMEYPEERTATGTEKIQLAQANNVNKGVYRKSLTHWTDFALNKLYEYKHDVSQYKGRKRIYYIYYETKEWNISVSCLLLCVETL